MGKRVLEKEVGGHKHHKRRHRKNCGMPLTEQGRERAIKRHREGTAARINHIGDV